jgi:hypothetical protein
MEELFAATRIWPAGPSICGGIFDGARLDDQLTEIERAVGVPGFWGQQAEAQKVMQRRRRLEEDVALRTHSAGGSTT